MHNSLTIYKGSVQKSRSFWRFGLCVTAHSDDGTHGRNFQHRRFSKQNRQNYLVKDNARREKIT